MITVLIYGCVAMIVLFGVLLGLATQITGRNVHNLFAELKSQVVYNIIGFEALVEDFILRKCNKIEPITKTGKIAIITGGTRGIGYEVIKLLLQCDMQVIMGCRKVSEGEKVITQIRANGITSGDFKVFQLDTSSNDSVRKFARCIQDNYSRIHYLINNAGIMFPPYLESADGFELQFATNYLGHFLLTHLLLPQLANGGSEEEKARVVNVSSCAYQSGHYNFDNINMKDEYVAYTAYGTSKLAQVHFTTHLNELMTNRKVNMQVHAVHPGVVNTGLFEYSYLKHLQWFMDLVFKKPIEGAYPIVYAAISPKLESQGGTYISNCIIKDLNTTAKNPKIAEQLFTFTMRLLNINNFGESA